MKIYLEVKEITLSESQALRIANDILTTVGIYAGNFPKAKALRASAKVKFDNKTSAALIADGGNQIGSVTA